MCLGSPTKWRGVPWGSFWGPQKPSISLFQQVQWWDLLMDKGSIVTDITEKGDTKRSAVEKAPTQNSQPLTTRTIKNPSGHFPVNAKKEAKTFVLGKSPYVCFEATGWQVLFLLILFLVLLLLFCPGQPSPKLSMVLHHNLCESQPCAMNSWKKKKKWFLVARISASPFFSAAVRQWIRKNRIKPFTVKLPREESKQPTPPENSCDSCMERRFLRLLKPRSHALSIATIVTIHRAVPLKPLLWSLLWSDRKRPDARQQGQSWFWNGEPFQRTFLEKRSAARASHKWPGGPNTSSS